MNEKNLNLVIKAALMVVILFVLGPYYTTLLEEFIAIMLVLIINWVDLFRDLKNIALGKRNE